MSEAVECWKLAPRARVWVIGMGCDKPAVEAQPAEDYVICVGRVEPHKNQLSLAQACKALGVRLELVGALAHPEYAMMCKAAGAHLCGELPEPERLDLLARARVHALPSFFENPGLAHAEAALMGIPGVLGNRGCEPEFFGPSGVYCDPTDPDDIASAIREAWHHPRRQWASVPTYDEMANVAWYALESLRCKSERSVEIPWLLSHVGHPARILDIGSAGAKYLTALAATGAEVTAVDTREFVPPAGVTSYQLDARKLPEEWAGRFDVVTCVSVLDHVGLDAYGNTEDATALPDVIREIERVITPSGRLLLTVPVGRPQLTTHPDGGQRVFSLNDIAAEAACAGLFDMDLWRWEQWCLWKRMGDTYYKAGILDILDAEYDGWRADACGAWEMTKL
jgi:SAM-dependent methyltransferase